jgi:recombinational DNA repair protein RecR
MYNTNKKRYYSPQFSAMASVSVRRLAWALGVSMPKAVDIIVKELSSAFSSSVVCPQCKDKSKCSLCGFNQQLAADNAALAG